MRKLIGTLLLLISFLITFGQQKINLEPNKEISQYILKNWTTLEGLPANAVRDIVQTPDGYIWLASFGGLTRFDGVSFKNYGIKNNHIPSDIVQTLSISKDTVIWVGTIDGIFRIKNNEIYDDGSIESIKNLNVETIHADREGRIWIGTNSSGVYMWENKKVTQIEAPQEINAQLISDIYQDRDNNIWLSTEVGSLFKYENNEFEEILSGNKTNGIFVIAQGSNDKFYVGAGNGLYIISNGQAVKNNKIKLENIQDIMEDQNKMLWLATLTGLYRFDQISGLMSKFDETNGLPNNIVHKIFADNEGNVWGATYRKGLFRLTGGQFLCYSTLEGLPSDIVMGIARYDDDRYLVATEDGKIVEFTNQKIKPFVTNAPIPNSRLKHIMIDSQKKIWISTYGGLLVIDRNSWKLYNEENGFDESLFRTSFEDTKGNVWVGSRRQGIYKFEKSGKIIHIGSNEGMSSDYVMSISETKDNKIVVGTKNGVNIIADNKVIQQYSTKNGLVSDFAFNIYVDNENILWICSNSGIDRVEGAKIVNFSTSKGLNDNSVFDIIEDKSGFFWMPTPKGIMQVRKSEFKDVMTGKLDKVNCNIYGKESGLKNNECIGATKTYVDETGVIGFLTMGGVALLDPDKMKINTLLPSLKIESIQLDSVLLPFTEKLLLEPDVKRMIIKYTGFSYKAPDKLKFKYKLDPYDIQWIEGDNTRAAHYTSLPPGKYNFQLKAANNDGLWTDSSLTFNIIAKPHFYQTWWFITLSVLAILFLSYLFYRNRLRAIEKQNIILEGKVAQRTAEVEQQKEEILAQKEMVEAQNLKINAKNEHIKSSIVYAGTIQNAILPLDRHMNQNYETFTVFRPKDIVSGDFYWLNFKKNGNYVFYATVDCTGHGVPGAFMSMVGSHLLAEIVSVRGILDPSEIMTRLDEYTYNSLQQNITDNTDGMDVCLVRLEKKDNNQTEVLFCGAKRPLYYYKNQEKKIYNIKGNRKSIAGKKRNSKNIAFENETLTLDSQDILYLTTDGFADQNNAQRKKFTSTRLLNDLESIGSQKMTEQKRYLEAELDAWQAQESQRDDITLIGIKL